MAEVVKNQYDGYTVYAKIRESGEPILESILLDIGEKRRYRVWVIQSDYIKYLKECSEESMNRWAASSILGDIAWQR